MSDFTKMLENLHRGELLDDIDEAMPGLIEKVKAYGGSGKIALTIDMKLLSEGQVEVRGTFKATPPKKKLGASLFYINNENTLQRNDPRQAQMFADTEAK